MTDKRFVNRIGKTFLQELILYRCSIRLVRFAKNERRLIKFIPTKKLIWNLKKREINLYT